MRSPSPDPRPCRPRQAARAETQTRPPQTARAETQTRPRQTARAETQTRPRQTAWTETEAREVAELLRRWRENADREARDEIFRRYQPLARRLAARYWSPYEPLDDLLQVAALGLLGAIDRFDPDRGVAFATFAVPTILGELKRSFRNMDWAAHVPRRAQELALRIEQALRELAASTPGPRRVDEIAQYLEISTEDVLTGLSAADARRTVSLDAPATPVVGGEATALVDSMGSEDEGYAMVELTSALSTVMSRLPHAQREALALRLSANLTQSEIAAQLGCSQMQVSRLLSGATALIRAATQ